MLWYTSPEMYRKRSLGILVFQHQIPSLCWPRLGWSDPDVYTTNLLCLLLFWTSKKTRQSPNYLRATVHHSNQSKIRYWYICLYISRVEIVPSFSWKDQTRDQLTATPTVWTSEEYCKRGDKFRLSIVAFFSSSFPLFILLYLSFSLVIYAHTHTQGSFNE